MSEAVIQALQAPPPRNGGPRKHAGDKAEAFTDALKSKQNSTAATGKAENAEAAVSAKRSDRLGALLAAVSIAAEQADPRDPLALPQDVASDPDVEPTLDDKPSSAGDPKISAEITTQAVPTPMAITPPPALPFILASRQAAVREADITDKAQNDAPAPDASADAKVVEGDRGKKPVTVISEARPSGGGDRPELEAASTEPVTTRPEVPRRDAPADKIDAPSRAAVTAQQSFAAPMATPPPPPLLAQAFETGLGWKPVAGTASSETIPQQHAGVSTHSMTFQLHPAELGTVTAQLRFAADRLSVELQVENQDAYRRLTLDSDAIVDALKHLGYDIDRITVLPPTVASQAVDRGAQNAANLPNSLPNGTGSADPGRQGPGGNASGRGKDGGRSDGDQTRPTGVRGTDPGAGGGLYI